MAIDGNGLGEGCTKTRNERTDGMALGQTYTMYCVSSGTKLKPLMDKLRLSPSAFAKLAIVSGLFVDVLWRAIHGGAEGGAVLGSFSTIRQYPL